MLDKKKLYATFRLTRLTTYKLINKNKKEVKAMKRITKNEKIATLQNKNKEIFDELKSISQLIKFYGETAEIAERYKKGEYNLANEEGYWWLRDIDARISFEDISYDKNKKFRALKKRLIKKSQKNLAKIAKLNSQNVR